MLRYAHDRGGPDRVQVLPGEQGITQGIQAVQYPGVYYRYIPPGYPSLFPPGYPSLFPPGYPSCTSPCCTALHLTVVHMPGYLTVVHMPGYLTVMCSPGYLTVVCSPGYLTVVDLGLPHRC